MIEELTMIECLPIDDLAYFLTLVDPSTWHVHRDPLIVHVQTEMNGTVTWTYDYLKSMFCHAG